MAKQERTDVRVEVLRMLLTKVAEDTHPSNVMMDMVEDLMMTQEELEAYAQVLMEKVSGDTYPSIPMLRRLAALR
jgi:hypothetical protein